MDFAKYYRSKKTFSSVENPRLNRIIDLVGKCKPIDLLDIGCGDGFLLKEIKKKHPEVKLSGVDVYKSKIKGVEIKSADITKGLPFIAKSFDCIILGEVIEHVPNPDFLLREISTVIKKNGELIISTPNLVSWANRVLVLFGVQPLFTETSSEVNLGRYFKILGEGGSVQGHLKIFTHKSLEEILMKEGFTIEKKIGVSFFFPFPISLLDQVFTHFVSLSSGLLYVARKK